MDPRGYVIEWSRALNSVQIDRYLPVGLISTNQRIQNWANFLSNAFCRLSTHFVVHQRPLSFTNELCRSPTPIVVPQRTLAFTNTHCRQTHIVVPKRTLSFSNEHCRSPTNIVVHERQWSLVDELSRSLGLYKEAAPRIESFTPFSS